MGTLYAAYGSNMNSRQMAVRCPNAKICGVGYIRDFVLTFRGNLHNAHADIVKDFTHCLDVKSVIPVIIWELSSADEKALDRYEGYPKYYKKTTLSVTRADNAAVVSCMAYVMNGTPSLGFPSPQYFATILQGYYENGINPEILFRFAAETCRLIRKG